MITSQRIDQIDELTFRLRFTSDRAPPVPFRVFVDGVLVSAWSSPTASGDYLVPVEPGTDPYIEILDRPNQRPRPAWPGNVLLVWDRVVGAASYRIEEFVGADWVIRATLLDFGASQYQWRTRWLPDALVYPFRVYATDSAGNDSIAASRSIAQVRHPVAPRVAYSFDAGTKKITVAQA